MFNVLQMNKKKVPPKQYLRVRVGYVMQFGGSSRVVSLIGPPEDKEDEWDVSPTEMKQKVHQKVATYHSPELLIILHIQREKNKLTKTRHM